jgi:rfaE bifunctional protein kinase chain/domain
MFKNKNILLIGDVILDKYLCGDVDRISPESPVPIINLKSQKYKLGGTLNVSLNIKKLNSTPFVCSVIGNDKNGNIIRKLMNENNIKTDNIIVSNRKTTTKTRIIGNDYQIARIDDEITNYLNKDIEKQLINNIKNVINNNKIDIILIQDYDKGVLTKKIIKTIIKFNSYPILIDPKKRNFKLYKKVKLIKPNLKELKEYLNINFKSKKELLEKGSKIIHKKNKIDIVVVTLSEDGIFLSYNKGKTQKYIKNKKRNIVDVSGAGDTVISVISTLIDTTLPIEKIIELSNISGGIVCEYSGVVPIDIKVLSKYYNNIN